MDTSSELNRKPSLNEEPRGFMASLSLARVGSTLVFALLGAMVLNPIFITSFPVLLGRTVFISVLSLLAFSAVGQWPKRLPQWLPRWGVQVAVVAVTLPLSTLLIYLLSVDGDVPALLDNPGKISGLFSISMTALFVGPLLALAALYRERDAQARSQALSFELEKSQLERQALDARLRLIQAQVEPHFLFNTLANVRTLVDTGSPKAGPVLGSLIAYLRGAMPRLKEQSASLCEELDLVRAYLELMHMRMPDRLQYSIEVPAHLSGIRFPPMALLTLVENAVRHGVDPSEVGGRIDVGASRDEASGVISLWVQDTGVGMSEQSGNGTGLTTLRERIVLFYGPDARLELTEPQPHGLRASISFKP